MTEKGFCAGGEAATSGYLYSLLFSCCWGFDSIGKDTLIRAIKKLMTEIMICWLVDIHLLLFLTQVIFFLHIFGVCICRQPPEKRPQWSKQKAP